MNKVFGNNSTRTKHGHPHQADGYKELSSAILEMDDATESTLIPNRMLLSPRHPCLQDDRETDK